jgi:hypothetical protein
MLQLTKKASNTWRKSAQNEHATFKSILVNYFNAQLPEDVQTALQAANIDICLPDGVECWTKSQIDKKGIFSLCAKFAPTAICGDDKQFFCISSKNEERTAFAVPQIIENLPNVQEEKRNGLYYYFVNTTRKKRETVTTKDDNGKAYTHKVTTNEIETVKMYVYTCDRFTFAQVSEILQAAINNKITEAEEEKKRTQADAQADALANGASNTSITDAGSAQADAAEAGARTKQRQKTNTRTKASEQITK